MEENDILEEEYIDYAEALAELRLKGVTPDRFSGTEEEIEIFTDIVCADTMLAEQIASESGCPSDIADLAREFLRHAAPLMRHAECHEILNSAAGRLAEVVEKRPRLTLQLLATEREAAAMLLESGAAPDVDWEEEIAAIEEESARIEGNIALAEAGDRDGMIEKGHIKNDPVEWTAAWEEVIDEVQRKVHSELNGETIHTFGMGFCHLYWSKMREVLWRYGIEWYSPAAMNPGTIFD